MIGGPGNMSQSELQGESYSADQLIENVERMNRFDSGGIGPGTVKQNDQHLLLAAYANFNARAVDAILAVMDPDVDWPNGLDGGRVYGHDGVREYWARQWSLINPHAEPINLSANEDGTIRVTVHLLIRRLDDSVMVDESVSHTYRIEHGLICRMDLGDE